MKNMGLRNKSKNKRKKHIKINVQKEVIKEVYERNTEGYKMANEAAKEEKMSHEELVQKVLENQPDDVCLYDLSELFRIFGDSTRIKILYSMFDTELNVGDMAKILNLSQSSVSHQLRILKDAKLVKFRREGKSMYYSLDDDHVRMILSLGMEHVEE